MNWSEHLPELLAVAGCLALLILTWLTVRYIPNDKVGIVEKLWSSRGSLREGALVALKGEAGFQPEVLRGGIHFGYWRWQFAVHKRPLITIKQGKMGYIFSRAGEALGPSQTLAKVVACNHYQDVREFLKQGQKGRQRASRESVYAISLAVSTSSPRTAPPWDAASPMARTPVEDRRLRSVVVGSSSAKDRRHRHRDPGRPS